ncbi:MAG: aminotransferase class I/II-fold pyridoxal phosphate-dependent enzyme [Elusimicrobiota bacterium]|nr:aminotransferase class I/II-fold pyridoxal phosphate-dependent enzyme [Elusimicrobiota bacterium]
MISPSDKIKNLPPYLFGAIDVLKNRAHANKQDVIDMGMGNPDLPTPKCVVDRLVDTVTRHPRTHRYPQAKGMPKFRKAVCDWYGRRFGVKLDPETEAVALIGSKEGIAHLCMAYLNQGDLVLVPNPCYPVHYNGVVLAGGAIHLMPLREENGYLPDLSAIPEKVRQRAKIMILNYPNNPTGAVIEDKKYLEEVVKFAKKYDIIVIYDNAYSEVTFGDYVAPSFLQVKGGKDVGVEFGSFSKTYNMAGWRIGWAAGNSEILGVLAKYKSYLDYGVPTFVQLSGVRALELEKKDIQPTLDEYEKRFDFFVKKLSSIGWDVQKPKATMYLWAKIPPPYANMPSLEFAELLIETTGIAVAPGIGFGTYGEGYVRIAMVTHYKRFHDAFLRLKKFMKNPPSQK